MKREEIDIDIKPKKKIHYKDNNKTLLECLTCGDMFLEGEDCYCDNDDDKQWVEA